MEQGRVHSIDHLAQGNLSGWAAEKVSTGLSASAFDQSCTAQVIENLHQKVGRDGFPLRKVLKPCKSFAVMVLRELRERPTSIL